MIRDFVKQRIAILEKAAKKPQEVDGYTFEEWDAISEAISKREGCIYCSLDIWRSGGIDESFPNLRTKYPMLFPKE